MRLFSKIKFVDIEDVIKEEFEGFDYEYWQSNLIVTVGGIKYTTYIPQVPTTKRVYKWIKIYNDCWACGEGRYEKEKEYYDKPIKQKEYDKLVEETKKQIKKTKSYILKQSK